MRVASASDAAWLHHTLQRCNVQSARIRLRGGLRLRETSARALLPQTSMLSSLTARFNRWTGALAGLALGLFDPVFFWLLGTRFDLDGSDVTWLVSGAFASTSCLLGFLIGLNAESRKKEQAASAALLEARARVSQAEKLASLGQLASAIAHEVRNPLAIIRSSVQNLGESVGDENGRETCKFVIEEIDRLTRVTGSLVAFARPLVPKRQVVPLQALATRTRSLAGPMLSEHPIEFRVQLHDRDADLDVDPDLVCQVLIGLLGNAAELMRDGGSVTLSSRQLDDGRVELRISDDGPGIPSELRERIFEPFFTTREGGSGLGLAVARQIVEAHEGTIEAAAAEGGGAEFRLQFRGAA